MIKKMLLRCACLFAFGLAFTVFAATANIEVEQAVDENGAKIENTVTVTITLEPGSKDQLDPCACVEVEVQLYDRDAFSFDDPLLEDPVVVKVCSETGIGNERGEASATVDLTFDPDKAKDADDGDGRLQVYAEVEPRMKSGTQLVYSWMEGKDPGKDPVGSIAFTGGSSDATDIDHTSEDADDEASIVVGEDSNDADWESGGGVENVMGQFTITPPQDGDMQLGGVQIEDLGQGSPEEDIETVQILVDLDSDGAADDDDLVLAESAFSGGKSLTVTFGQPYVVEGETDFLVSFATATTVSETGLRAPWRGFGAPLSLLAPLALLGVVSRSGRRRFGLWLLPGLLLLAACSSQPHAAPRTHQVQITAVDAWNAATAEAVEVRGLPVAGKTMTIVE